MSTNVEKHGFFVILSENILKGGEEMNKIERKAFWKKYWKVICEQLLSMWILFVIGVGLIIVGSLNSANWKMFLTIVVISIGVVMVVLIPVGTYLALRRYKTKK